MRMISLLDDLMAGLSEDEKKALYEAFDYSTEQALATSANAVSTT